MTSLLVRFSDGIGIFIYTYFRIRTPKSRLSDDLSSCLVAVLHAQDHHLSFPYQGESVAGGSRFADGDGQWWKEDASSIGNGYCKHNWWHSRYPRLFLRKKQIRCCLVKLDYLSYLKILKSIDKRVKNTAYFSIKNEATRIYGNVWL